MRRRGHRASHEDLARQHRRARTREARLALAESSTDGDEPPRRNTRPPATARAASPPSPPRRPKLRKLRIALVVFGLSVLAFVSWIFGIMMAVAQDLPQLEDRAQYERAENSVIYDVHGERVGTLTNNEGRILIPSEDIAPVMKQATVAIEDERFYDHRGVDFEGIGRAVFQDILSQSASQGGSTITQQFVKNALEAQADRTVFQKLREAALAYHLERQWSKDKILTEYLNSIYFGQGAYGVEAAAETYFGTAHPGCGDGSDPCASELLPWEAALLAGIISSPTLYDPVTNPVAAEERRNQVLQKMSEQGAIAPDELAEYSSQPLPQASDIRTPIEDSVAPYFTTWIRQQLVDLYGAGQAFGGGLRVTSTLDLELQEQAESIVESHLGGLGPSAAVVVLDNATGGVRAMVGGSDYAKSPFNLATQGHRQPGSAFKPFTLITALQQGHSPSEVYSSRPKDFTFNVQGYKEPQHFIVHNYNDSYLGSASIATATTYSDNSVYAELGLDVGTENIAKTAETMGIETKISTNPAMILGGLERGVTPLEMAHAYTTLAHDGQLVSGSMTSDPGGPVGLVKVLDGDGDTVEADNGASGENKVETKQAISPEVAETARSILETVVAQGTGTRAAIGGETVWGKTGTTENNGDAWFVGSTPAFTIAVWVGHAESNKPMETEFGGQPVDGGTIPALIFHDIALYYEQLRLQRQADAKVPEEPPPTTPVPPTTTTTVPAPAPEPVPETDSEEPPVESTPPPEGGAQDGSGEGGGTAAG